MSCCFLDVIDVVCNMNECHRLIGQQIDHNFATKEGAFIEAPSIPFLHVVFFHFAWGLLFLYYRVMIC